MTRPKLTHMPYQEAARLAALRANEHDCAACGLVGQGCFGFGIFRNRPGGAWSCSDPECRAIVHARVYGQEKEAAA